MYLFVLGRQPEIAVAELQAIFGNVKLILPQVALVESATPPDINRLGGTRKIGRVIFDESKNPNDFLVSKFSELPPGKITLGISHYGKTASAVKAQKTGISIKKQLNRSLRVLPNSTPEISDAAALGNRLGTTANKVELLMVFTKQRIIIAELIGVQDLNSYTLRDRGRPRRDARVGMLPPKLAQMMINLATAGKVNSQQVILDPFCGTGVVLQEALLAGYSVYGTDIEPRMIEYTKTNLKWANQQTSLKNLMPRGDQIVNLTVGDATEFNWTLPIDYVVSETYLGQPYATEPSMEKLRENMNTCNIIIEKFLNNIYIQLKSDTPLCLAVPAWFVGGRIYHLPVINNTQKIGFDRQQPNLIYRREDQVVGRELLVLSVRK